MTILPLCCAKKPVVIVVWAPVCPIGGLSASPTMRLGNGSPPRPQSESASAKALRRADAGPHGMAW